MPAKTDFPHPTTLRVRNHRRKKALLSSLQKVINKRGDTSALDALEAAVEALRASEEDEQNVS
jgi:hypothetical protein